jgi:hypothetical protein
MTSDAIAGSNGISAMTADAIADNNGIPDIARPYIFQINRRKMTCLDCFTPFAMT